MNDSKANKRRLSLTEGNVWKTLLFYCLPLFGSAMFQQIYSLVDLLIVGNFSADGENALAAVGEATIILNVLLAFALGANGGLSVVVAKHCGKGDNKGVRETVNTAIITFGVMCVLVMTVGFSCGNAFMAVMDVDETITADSLSYLYIYTGSLPFVFAYNLGCGILAALGDSKTPFIFLVMSSLLNIGLDLLFVRGLHADVAGAAWATFISQALATILTVIVLVKRLHGIKSEQKPRIFSGNICKELLAAAVPVILQNSFVSVGNFFVQKRINSIGVGAAAGFTAAFKLVSLANTAVGNMVSGIANFCSQNKAAENYGRVKKGVGVGMIYCVSISIIFTIIFVSFPEFFTKIFITDPSDEAKNCSQQFLTYVSLFLPIVCVKLVCDGAVRGCGGNIGFTVSTFSDLIIRVVFVYILTGVGLGFTGVCAAWMIGWTLGMFVAVGFYLAIKCLRGYTITGKPKKAKLAD
ncbi:MAG: MATE family efflux transporter [Clostridia bacterium]|nr:MATE family efflux transporter [Clostridia bacterium]